MSHLGILQPSVPCSTLALSPVHALLISFHLSCKHNTAETNSATPVKQSAVILNATMPDAGIVSKWHDTMKKHFTHFSVMDSYTGVMWAWIHLNLSLKEYTSGWHLIALPWITKVQNHPFFFLLMGVSDTIVWPDFHHGQAGKQPQTQDWYHLVFTFTF